MSPCPEPGSFDTRVLGFCHLLGLEITVNGDLFANALTDNARDGPFQNIPVHEAEDQHADDQEGDERTKSKRMCI